MKVNGMITRCVILCTIFNLLFSSLPVGSPSIHFSIFSLFIKGGKKVVAARNMTIKIQAFHKPILKAGMKDMIASLNWQA